MGPIFVYLVIATSFIAGILRPKFGIAGYLFLLYLQPDWNWRWEGLYGIQYQKYLVISCAIGLLLHGLGKNMLLGWRSVSLGCLICFVAWCAVSYAFSSMPEISSVYFDVLWKTAFVSYLIAKLAESPEDAILIGWAIVIGSGYNALRINEDYFSTGVTRYVNNNWGYKGDSNVYTLFTFPALVLAAVLSLTSSRWYLKIFASSIAILHVHQLMLLESRGGLLGAGFSASIFLVFVRKNFYVNTAILVGMIAVSLLAGPPVVKEFRSIFAAEEERDSSAASRLTLWRVTTEIFFDNPIVGVGPNVTQFLIPKHLPEYADLEAKHPHNFILEIGSGMGVPGVIAILGFLGIPYYIVFMRRKSFLSKGDCSESLALFSISMLPGFALASLFAGGAMIESIYFFAALVFCLIRSENSAETELDEIEPQIPVILPSQTH
jgi:O-antigen ligase